MAEQIVRELINGEWITVPDAGGGGGSLPAGWTQDGAGVHTNGVPLILESGSGDVLIVKNQAGTIDWL